MIQGLIAAVAALALLTAVLYGIQDYLPEMDISQSSNYISTIYISIVALSLLLTMVSTIVSMKRYLNADIDKFYM